VPRDQVFISYSHEDTKWREDLEKNLKPYLRGGSIVSWSDQQIAPGSKWFAEIKSALTDAKVAVLLVTPDFLASDFIHEHELGPLLKEADQGGVKILWVLVRDCAYRRTPLQNYQAILSLDTPLAAMTKAKRDQAWVTICEKIEKAINSSRDFLPSGNFVAEQKIGPIRQQSLADQVQERLGEKYIIKDKIALGKLAIIYRAERIQPKQTVAVKVLVASELDEEARKSFIDGATCAVKLTSPAFIKIFDHSMEKSPEFLVSEFVEGEKLNSYLQRYRGGLQLIKVKSILLDLAEALEEVHEQGFCRGIMCPSDILIQASGHPRLSPFDFSNLLRKDARKSGNFLVDRESLTYMTPEWFFGNEDDQFTDQYSLGIIATELLGGTPIPPVHNPCDLERRHSLFTELESGNKGAWTKCSRPFRDLVCKMLSTDPSKRWSSMTEVREHLQILGVAPGFSRSRMRKQ
jgi:hypothetical protein